MLFDALASASVNVVAIAQGASEYNITVVVKNADITKALGAVHGRFYLSKTVISVALVGPGLVGKTLLRQFNEQLAELKKEYAADLRVVAVAATARCCSPATPPSTSTSTPGRRTTKATRLSRRTWPRSRSTSSMPGRPTTSSSTAPPRRMSRAYKEWLQRGINVVTPNKKANSGPLKYYKELRNIQRNGYTHYFYEGTVGAGLPIISTVRNLMDSGDRAGED